MKIKKLEDIELPLAESFSPRVHELEKEIFEKVEPIEAEYICELAGLCYRTGFKDGYRLSDWLQETTR